MKKTKYTTVGMRCVSLDVPESVLASSIVSSTTTVIIPRGQKVDVYDFSSDEFCHDWEITSTPNE